MNYFLIDYENVSDISGLYGVENLGKDDCLVFFYSQSSYLIRNDIWNTILESGCKVKMYKLLTPRENALDFYIAAEAAALCERGEQQVAIITKDKDLNSVTEFLNMKANSDTVRIRKAPSLENAMALLNDDLGKERRSHINEARIQRDLSDLYKKYIQEENKKKKTQITNSQIMAIKQEFEEDNGSETCDKIIATWEMVEAGQIREYNELYQYCRKTFGAVNGTSIYNGLKRLNEEGRLYRG